MIRLVAAGLLLCAMAAPAHGQCGDVDVDVPVVEVVAIDRGVVRNDEISISGLSNMVRNPLLSSKGYVTLGATTADYSLRLNASIKMVRTRSGGWCAWPSEVLVEHGFSKPLTVYIAKDLTPGSCVYDTTMRHEMDHVAVHRWGLAAATAEIEAVMRAHFSSQPIYGHDKAEATSSAQRTLSRVVNAASSRILAEVARRNAAMDTPASYAALSKVCENR